MSALNIRRLLSLGLGVGLTFSAHAQTFTLSCGAPPAPLAPILTAIDQSGPTAIDMSCGPDGGSTKLEKQLESRAKNDFCASNSVVTITTGTLTTLQQKTTPAIKSSLGASRSALQGLVKVSGAPAGEGTQVRMAAYLLEAHFPKSNVKKGEQVNCKEKGEENNDIHIALVSSANEDDACNSFTAEMSPHFRPEVWSDLVKLNPGSRPVRVTGALFFDGSHQPCGVKRTSPPRASVWEIHPVYAFDVCKLKNKSKCKANDESMWIPLHEWIGDDPDVDGDH